MRFCCIFKKIIILWGSILKKGEHSLESVKSFYGGTFLSTEELKETNINYKIELQYYKTKLDLLKEDKKSYGVGIIKKEYKDVEPNIEKSRIDGITESHENIEELLKKLYENKVTPIALEEIILDMKKV